MDFVHSIVLPFLVLSFGQFIMVSHGETLRKYTGIIAVKNGQAWGSWGKREMCPEGTFAIGFSLKVERSVGDGDDTALNGIALHCSKPLLGGVPAHYTTISSSVGSWGTWTHKNWCSIGVMHSFQLLVESQQGHGDDTAANNIRFYCTGLKIMTGKGMSWGSWGTRSSNCPGTGICGIQTKVEPPQGSGDDTALNDVRFYCC